jgi:serine/threonine-protein kinase
MFLAEAKLATFLNHQNIVHVFDMGRGPDGLFIVMELVDGWDLGVLIDRAAEKTLTFPPPLAAFVTSQVLAGLCHAYRQKHEGKSIIVAHRDLSPSNILVSAGGEVKVADFGIARLEAFHRTEPGTFKGKIAYSAPEVLRGQPATVASDQFSLGIVLQEMLTGDHPFGHFENAMAYADAIVHGTPAELRGVVPLPLLDVVRRALSKSPSERFESPEAFAKALARFLASTGTPTSTHELAEFLPGLNLPPVPSELSAQDTVIRSSFSLHRLQSIPPHVAAGPDATSLRSGMGGEASVSPDELEALQADWAPTGASMDSSGQVENQAALRKPPPRVVVHAPVPTQEPLVLAHEPAPRVESETTYETDRYPVERIGPERSRRTGERSAWGLILLGLAAAIGLVLYLYGPTALYKLASERVSKLQVKLDRLRPSAPVLQIESDPPGATVQIGDQQLGTTPLYTENYYPHTEIEISVLLKGYRPWKGKFSGGETASIRAKLKPR